MMNHVLSVSTPLPAFARAAVFALAAIAAVGIAQAWQHRANAPSPAVPATVDAQAPLAAAPSPVDMWNL